MNDSEKIQAIATQVLAAAQDHSNTAMDATEDNIRVAHLGASYALLAMSKILSQAAVEMKLDAIIEQARRSP